MPFGLGALSLAVQFYMGCVQSGVALPRNTPHSFLKVYRIIIVVHECVPITTLGVYHYAPYSETTVTVVSILLWQTIVALHRYTCIHFDVVSGM